MGIIESFDVYLCTKCDHFHISDMDRDSVFKSHSQFHDPHGIVTRYRLNERIDWIMFVVTGLFTVGYIIALFLRIISASVWWTAALCFSAVWLIFVYDRTFGPSPWRWRKVRFWADGYVADVMRLAAMLLIVGVAMRGRLETLLDWTLLAICIVVTEASVLIKTFAKHGQIPWDTSWIGLLFLFWFLVAGGLWVGPPTRHPGRLPWDKAAINGLKIVLAFAIFSLLLIGIIKAIRSCWHWLLVQLVRGWRRAERVVDEKVMDDEIR
jgi:hypothetical protein